MTLSFGASTCCSTLNLPLVFFSRVFYPLKFKIFMRTILPKTGVYGFLRNSGHCCIRVLTALWLKIPFIQTSDLSYIDFKASGTVRMVKCLKGVSGRASFQDFELSIEFRFCFWNGLMLLLWSSYMHTLDFEYLIVVYNSKIWKALFVIVLLPLWLFNFVPNWGNVMPDSPYN